jgi:hypothetical protein
VLIEWETMSSLGDARGKTLKENPFFQRLRKTI